MEEGISPLYGMIKKNTMHLSLTAAELNYIHNTHKAVLCIVDKMLKVVNALIEKGYKGNGSYSYVLELQEIVLKIENDLKRQQRVFAELDKLDEESGKPKEKRKPTKIKPLGKWFKCIHNNVLKIALKVKGYAAKAAQHIMPTLCQQLPTPAKPFDHNEPLPVFCKGDAEPYVISMHNKIFSQILYKQESMQSFFRKLRRRAEEIVVDTFLLESDAQQLHVLIHEIGRHFGNLYQLLQDAYTRSYGQPMHREEVRIIEILVPAPESSYRMPRLEVNAVRQYNRSGLGRLFLLSRRAAELSMMGMARIFEMYQNISDQTPEIKYEPEYKETVRRVIRRVGPNGPDGHTPMEAGLDEYSNVIPAQAGIEKDGIILDRTIKLCGDIGALLNVIITAIYRGFMLPMRV